MRSCGGGQGEAPRVIEFLGQLELSPKNAFEDQFPIKHNLYQHATGPMF